MVENKKSHPWKWTTTSSYGIHVWYVYLHSDGLNGLERGVTTYLPTGMIFQVSFFKVFVYYPTPMLQFPYIFGTKLPGKPIYQITIVPWFQIYRELEDEGLVFQIPSENDTFRGT